MGERLKPWRAKPPPELAELIQKVPSTRLYLVQRSGPTSFILRGEESEKKHRVMLGATPSCSCCPGSSSGGCRELCVHVLFVMMKILRVPPSNPLVWQLYLTDRELDEVLRCTNAPQVLEKKEGKGKRKERPVGEVDRKPLSEEEPCPICYDDMTTADEAELVYCRYSCGNSVHGKCMRIWSDHQATLGSALSCPLCRGDWGDFKWRPVAIPRRKKQAAPSPGQAGLHLGTRCAGCRVTPIAGTRYRCVVCGDLSLCQICFQAGHHPQHPLACKETPTSSETMAEREALMPSATALSSSPQPVEAEMSTSGRPPPANSNAVISRSTSGSRQRRRSLPASSNRTMGSKARLPPWQSPDMREAQDGGKANKARSLGECLSIGSAAGLPQATLTGGSYGGEGIDGGDRCGVGQRLPPHKVSGAPSAGEPHRCKPISTVRSNKLPPPGQLPSLDIAGSTIRGPQPAVDGANSDENGSAAEATTTAPRDASAVPTRPSHRSARRPPNRSTSITLGDFPSEPASLPGLNGTAVRTAHRGSSSDGEGCMSGGQQVGGDCSQPTNPSKDAANGGGVGASLRRRRQSASAVPADLPQIDSPFAPHAGVTGFGLGRDGDDGGEDASTHSVRATGAVEREAGPPPGETWGGRRLPAIRRGTTKKIDASPRTESSALETEDSLDALCIGTSRKPSGAPPPPPYAMKPVTQSRRTFSNKLLVAGRSEPVPVPSGGAPGMCDTTGLHISRLDGQAAGQPSRYMSVLDTFFEGPGFDPTFHAHQHDYNENTSGAHSLPPRFSIPVIVTAGEASEWVTEVNSPIAGGTPGMAMSEARRALSDSLDSPSAHLPMWIQADTAFASDA